MTGLYFRMFASASAFSASAAAFHYHVSFGIFALLTGGIAGIAAVIEGCRIHNESECRECRWHESHQEELRKEIQSLKDALVADADEPGRHKKLAEVKRERKS